MSRGQSSQTFGTATSQNATNFGNSQADQSDAQSDIGDYKNQLAKFVSSNPYTAGGEYDQTINKGLANVSDAGSASLKGALQSQAQRTGQNSAADAATAASGAQANTRQLSSDLASAQQQRISGEAGYNTTALGASAQPASMESGLASTAGGQGNQELSTAEGAAQTPSFWDQVGSGVASGFGKALGGKV